ncbi:MAG TPA: cache domain-containing protein, partial [Chloroflexota bacterium]|nr:cache domain-containing protein [Chloroflexota bacterium]
MASLGTRSKLLLLVAVAALPLVLLICAELARDLWLQKQNASQILYRSAQLLGENADSSMSRARDLLIVLAEHPDIRFGSAEARDKVLADTGLRYPEFESLYFVQTNGIDAGLPAHRPGTPRNDYSDRAYFKDALSTGGFTLSKVPVIGKSNGKWMVPMLQPVRDDDGQLLGFVGGGISLGAIREGFRGQELGPGAIFLFDESGTVLVHEGPSEDGRPLDGVDLSTDPIWDRALHAQDSIVEMEYPKGVRSLARTYKLNFAPWYVVLIMPEELVFGPQMRDFFADLAFAGSCLAMGVILALLLSKLIAKRIQYITLSTARIGAGDLSQRLNVTGHDEIAKLAAQFNVMVEQLQQAMDSEKAVAERYQRLLENIADGYVILQNGEIVYSNRQMGTMLGYDVASLVGIKVASLVSPEFAKKAENHLNSRLRGEELPSNSEWELRTADGRYLPIEINSHTIEYLGRPALASTVRDVTQRRQMEAQRARLIREEAEGKALRDLLHQ